MICDHAKTEIRIRYQFRAKRKGRGRLYLRQCLTCGRGVGQPFKKGDVPDHLRDVPFDASLPDFTSRSEARRGRKQNPYISYAKYIKSAAWKAKRSMILCRSGGRCEKCGAKDRPIHVHHLHYDTLRAEQPEDLLALCKSCHSNVHRASRSTSSRSQNSDEVAVRTATTL